MLVGDALRVRRAGEKPRDALHRPGAVERDDGGDVLDAARAQPHAHGRDARALELEHADGAPGGEHVKRLLIVERDALDLKPRLAAAHLPRRVLEHGEVAQAEKVHLQQPQLLERRHLELAHERAVVAGQRHVGVHRLLRDDHARRVRGRMPRHALDGAGRVDELVQPVVPVIHGAQRLRLLQRLVERGVDAAGDGLGHSVHLGVGHVHDPADVAHCRARGHRAERDDLRHVVGAVFADDVVDHFPAPLHAEVHVDIRHAYALGVEKALEVEVILHGIDVRDAEAVGHDAAGSAAAPRPDGDVLGLGVADEIAHDEKVVHKAHAPDHVELIIQTLSHLRPVAVAFFKAARAQLREIGVRVRLPLRQQKARQVVVAEREVEMAPVSNALRVFHRVGIFVKERAHLGLALEVKLVVREAQAVRAVERLPGLDAQQHVLIVGVLFFNIVYVVRRREGDARLAVDAQQRRTHARLVGHVVVLQLEVEVPLTEELLQFHGARLGRLIISPQHRA